MVVFKDSDLVFYPSGTTGNCLGGPIYTTNGTLPEVMHAVFNVFSTTERTLGKTKYRCIYMKNTSTISCINPKVFISQNTPSSGTELYVSFDKANGVGNGTSSGVADTIPDESTAPDSNPPGVFTNGKESSQGDALSANLPPGKTVPIWFRCIISPNTEKSDLDGAEFAIQASNEKDVEGVVETPVDTTTVVVGETEVNDFFAKLMERLRLRFMNWFVVTGNTSSNSDPRPWLNMLGTLKDRTALSFGYLDNINPQMKNNLTTALSGVLPGMIKGYYHKKQNNLYEIFMDVTIPFENPSPQYDFIKANLIAANNDPKIDFIIVYCNKAFYATLAANDPAQAIDGRFRTTYHKLFEDNGVHVVVSSQFRNYQRQKVLSWNEAAPDTPGEYTTGAPNYVISTGQKAFGSGIGCLFIIDGLGGRRPLHTLATPKSYTAYSYYPVTESTVGYKVIKSEMKRTNALTGEIIKPAKLTISFYEVYIPTFFQAIFGYTVKETLKDQCSITIDPA